MLGHDSHGHAEATANGCAGTLPTIAEDVSHGGNVFGIVSASYTDLGGAGGVPALTTVDQVAVLQKRQEVEFVVDQSGTNTAPTADVGGGLQRGSLGNGDWIALNGTLQPAQHRLADVPHVGGSGRPAPARSRCTSTRSTGRCSTTVTIAATANATTYASQTFPVADPGGAHRIYLVFRPVAGGPREQLLQPQLGRVRRTGGERAVAQPRAGRGQRCPAAPAPRPARSACNASARYGSVRWFCSRKISRRRLVGRRGRGRGRGADAARPGACFAAHDGRHGRTAGSSRRARWARSRSPSATCRAGSASRRARRSACAPTMGFLGGPDFPEDPTDLGPAGAAARRLARAARVPGATPASSRSSSPATARTPPTPAGRRRTRPRAA